MGISPKEISLCGSARLGYSLAPGKGGNEYRPGSLDLDFFAVSQRLFDALRTDFENWREDYDRGVVTLRGGGTPLACESRGNAEKPVRGFVDSKRVPNRSRYPCFQNVNGCLARLKAQLKETAEAPDRDAG